MQEISVKSPFSPHYCSVKSPPSAGAWGLGGLGVGVWGLRGWASALTYTIHDSNKLLHEVTVLTTTTTTIFILNFTYLAISFPLPLIKQEARGTLARFACVQTSD